jgi:hypothetical protein
VPDGRAVLRPPRSIRVPVPIPAGRCRAVGPHTKTVTRRPGQSRLALPLAPAIVLMLVLVAAGANAALAAGEGHGRERVLAGRKAGDVVRAQGVALKVPRRGETTWGEILLADGSFRTLVVRNARDGAVTVAEEQPPARQAGKATRRRGAVGGDAVLSTTQADSTTQRAECLDPGRNAYSWRFPDFRWRFNPTAMPSYLRDHDGGPGAVLDVIRRAQDNITSGRNLCDRPDSIDAVGQDIGVTNRGPNISSGAGCTGGDGISVVGFGPLPSYVLAMACVYGARNGLAAEGDVRIATTARWALSRATCRGSTMLLEAVMTHEFGHIYGLGHVHADRNPTLTMRPVLRACSNAASTLGLGDLLGLERKY